MAEGSGRCSGARAWKISSTTIQPPCRAASITARSVSAPSSSPSRSLASSSTSANVAGEIEAGSPPRIRTTSSRS
ncbi:hypothetical protein AB0C28_28755 [Nonomuraea sp. NPDC048892]|uniref:hypothetical protein n=1 Tax=Nonomuraea sp. NPDC048892 TaxID=3154624 RepID=UPI0033EF45E7